MTLNDTCIFCSAIAGRLAADIVLENEHILAFRDINPQAPVHVLVVPKTHVAGFNELPGDDTTWNHLLTAVQLVAKQEQVSSGFRVVINQGADGGQTVNHLHIHVLGGRAMHWPPG
jgi:histidine triad (HIT) family protein